MGLAGPVSNSQDGGVKALTCFAYHRWRRSDPLVFASLHRLEPLAQAHAGTSASRLESNPAAHLCLVMSFTER